MGTAIDRIDSALLEKAQYDELLRVLGKEPWLVGSGGERFELPEGLVRFLTHAAQAMRGGQSISLVPEKACLTTQEAADYLGMSRPFLIGLLEKGDVAFSMVGTHRRIRFKDLRAYETKRDRERRKTLDDLFDAIDRDGLYYAGLDELARPNA